MASLSDVYSVYTKKPLNFWYPLLAFLAFSLIGLLFLLFIYMNIARFFELANINIYYVLAFFSIIGLYIVSGFKGAMIRGFAYAYKTSERFDTWQFFNYASSNNMKFFIIYFVKVLINVAIIVSAYILLINQQTLIQIIGAFVIALILFIINYLLHFSAIAIVLYENIGALRALKASIIVALTNVFYLIGPYILYLIALGTFIIPLINIFTLFIFYPVVEIYVVEKLRKLDVKIARSL
ncbi:MAG: hypothetical protein QXS91_00275 [Candidatus Anstonellales archaeon]